MSGSGLIDLSHFVLVSLAKMKALEVAAVSGLGPLNALNIISLVFLLYDLTLIHTTRVMEF